MTHHGLDTRERHIESSLFVKRFFVLAPIVHVAWDDVR